jgi:hypothetical protein
MAKKIHISATQLTMFLTCPRSWAWSYIARVPRERALALELGIRVHEILEAYYRGEAMPDRSEIWRFNPGEKIYYPGKIADSMLNAAIPRQPSAVEVQFDKHLDGVHYTGKIDVLQRHANRIEIFDHKTSSSPAKWGKTPDDLLKDIQRNLYCWAAREDYLPVNFALNYGCTDGKPQKAKLVKAASSLDDSYFLNEIHPTAKLMVELKEQKTNPLDLPPEPAACGMFRGCPHKERCALTTRDRVKGIIMANSMIAELLEKSKAAAKAAPVKPEAAPPLGPPEKAPVVEAKAEPKVEAKPKRTRAKSAPKVETVQVENVPVENVRIETASMPNLVQVAAAIGELAGIAKGAAPEIKNEIEDLKLGILENLERI